MANIGEDICGDYLNHILGCEFVSYNVTNPDIQGEIDVIGIEIEKRTLYLCEVATHTGGLQYVTDKRPDDYNWFYSKFQKNIDYAKKYFSDFNVELMLWSPVVKIQGESAKYNTYQELIRLQDDIKRNFNLKLELVINENYHKRFNQLRDYAGQNSSMFQSPVMRLLQIEENLNNHVEKLNLKN